jgi:hypothetical protein
MERVRPTQVEEQWTPEQSEAIWLVASLLLRAAGEEEQKPEPAVQQLPFPVVEFNASEVREEVRA